MSPETTDWVDWHRAYERPDSSLLRRMRVVQKHIGTWLDATAPAPVTVSSVCAGEGRDLLEVLAGRLDAERVTATLLERDSRLVAVARQAADRAGLSHVTVKCADAGSSDAFAGGARADLLLLCGVFGNTSDGDVRRLVRALPQLCNPGAIVIWTRHHRAPDLTPRIRAWFAAESFDLVDFTAPDDAVFSVGVHRFGGEPVPLIPGRRLFTFTR